jgi:hypothetical protein
MHSSEVQTHVNKTVQTLAVEMNRRELRDARPLATMAKENNTKYSTYIQRQPVGSERKKLNDLAQ